MWGTAVIRSVGNWLNHFMFGWLVGEKLYCGILGMYFNGRWGRASHIVSEKGVKGEPSLLIFLRWNKQIFPASKVEEIEFNIVTIFIV